MTTTYTPTDYRPGQRIRYGSQVGTFIRYADEIPASVIGGRIVCVTSSHRGGSEAVAWEKDTMVAELGDIGAHLDETTGRYVGPNYGWLAR